MRHVAVYLPAAAAQLRSLESTRRAKTLKNSKRTPQLLWAGMTSSWHCPRFGPARRPAVAFVSAKASRHAVAQQPLNLAAPPRIAPFSMTFPFAISAREGLASRRRHLVALTPNSCCSAKCHHWPSTVHPYRATVEAHRRRQRHGVQQNPPRALWARAHCLPTTRVEPQLQLSPADYRLELAASSGEHSTGSAWRPRQCPQRTFEMSGISTALPLGSLATPPQTQRRRLYARHCPTLQGQQPGRL
mmetsp:Transcript_7066/g.15209  ORF Transcript_7066/g.15209 Transcript_7066/m.15209 type:complete len:245 (+) Transcript_7066:529-1263(+)